MTGQKREEYGKNFFKWLSDFTSAPDDFRKLALEISNKYDQSRYVSDPDLKDHVDTYRNDIKNGRSVLVVAHSQGNFYANSAWHLLENSADTKGHFYIVSVASPVDAIAGGGPYTTLAQDIVINAVRKLTRALPANVTNSKTSLLGHEFVSQYLKGDQSGPKIIDDIRQSLWKINNTFTTASKEALEYQDQSLWPFMRYACVLKNQTSKFSDAECIALSALDRTYAWSGESRDVRSVKSLIQWIDDCDKKLWHEADRFDFLDCSLLGDGSGFDLRGAGQLPLFFVTSDHPECHWRGKEVSRRATPMAIASAQALLQSPPKASDEPKKQK